LNFLSQAALDWRHDTAQGLSRVWTRNSRQWIELAWSDELPMNVECEQKVFSHNEIEQNSYSLEIGEISAGPSALC
jgi:hypothetical protein